MKIKKKYIICFVILMGYAYTAVAQKEICSCCTDNHKAFDFWIGEWTVTNPDGTFAGSSNIVKLESNCVIQENWKSAKSGYTGVSTNFYNLISGQWEQLWVDNAGAHLKLRGNRVRNQMILSSEEFRDSTNALIRNRITWTLKEDGTVRQLWEVLESEKVIRVAFDGLYSRRE